MEKILIKKIEQAIWVANSLFQRGKTSGSSANLSFLHEGKIYITASGTCFGTLDEESFSIVSMDGQFLNSKTPSKELPLHRYYYEYKPTVQAVIHTHGPYSTLWSCRSFERTKNIIPSYTPYLRMKVGTVGLIPYATPGSQELFQFFQNGLENGDAYLLKNHGAIVGAKCIMDAFFAIEEIEESARIAYCIDGNMHYDLIT